MQTASFTTGKMADFLLLVASLEIEASQIGAGRHFEASDGNQVGTVADVFKNGFFVFKRFP